MNPFFVQSKGVAFKGDVFLLTVPQSGEYTLGRLLSRLKDGDYDGHGGAINQGNVWVAGCLEFHRDEGPHLHALLMSNQTDRKEKRFTLNSESLNSLIGRVVNIKVVTGGVFDKKTHDTLQYILKQINETLGRKETTWVTRAEYNDHQTNMLGDFEDIWDFLDAFIEKTKKVIISSGKRKRDEPVDKDPKYEGLKNGEILTLKCMNMLVEGELDENKLLDSADYKMSAYYIMNRAKILPAAQVKFFSKMKQKCIIDGPRLDVIPMWNPDNMLPNGIANKRRHLYLWGDSNQGKTVTIKKFFDLHNIRYVSMANGTAKLPAGLMNAHALIVEDALSPDGNSALERNMDGTALPWNLVLNWCNGCFMEGVYKEVRNYEKLIVICSNYPPTEVFRAILRCPDQFKNRFYEFHCGQGLVKLIDDYDAKLRAKNINPERGPLFGTSIMDGVIPATQEPPLRVNSPDSQGTEHDESLPEGLFDDL